MSDFEHSPRSLKRRKVSTSRSAGSEKARKPITTYHDDSVKVTRTSRRFFKPRAQEDELIVDNRSSNVQDSAYGSKEDSLSEEHGTCPAAPRLAERYAGDSESADELAQPGVTTTPIKPQRNRLKQKEGTPKTVEKAVVTRGGEGEAKTTPVGTRSSGRERKRPRRFSSTWDDGPTAALPKGILTPSKKGNRTPQKSVAFEPEGVGVEEDLGFKDLDKSIKKKTGKAKRRAKPDQSDNALDQVEKDVAQVAAGITNAQELNAGHCEDQRVPVVPELPDLAVTPPLDYLPVPTDSRLDAAKTLVMSRLTGQILAPLTALEAEYAKLYSLLSATINAGEGNSILLLGSRGVGKTCLVETAIADLAVEHSKDFHVVRLSGFLQSDDKLALREIWRQLGREMQVEEEETAQVNSYADTMASLLHLLSHPEELAETFEPDAAAKTTKSVVFVLDEFDLFTTHPRQTLLYNLFDIAQARKAPIAVIGCSARVDVSDNLEKRVKSRFSHRWIHLSQAKSFSAFEEIAKAALIIREHDQLPKTQSMASRIRADWNAFIEKVFLPSSHVQSLLKHCFFTTKSIPEAFSSLYVDIATIHSLDQSSLTPAALSELRPPDTVLEMLPDLPALHLSLLISTARLDAIHNATVATFALVYSHYVELVSRARLQASAAGSIAQATKLWNRDIAAAAWDELAEWEIILPAAGKATEGAQAKMWRCDVVLEEIIGAVGGADAGMSDVMIRWCKEV